MTVRLVTSTHIEETPAVDITWADVLTRLNTRGIQLGTVPEIVADDPVYKTMIIANAYFVQQILTREEARFLALTITDIPNKTIADIISLIDRN